MGASESVPVYHYSSSARPAPAARALQAPQPSLHARVRQITSAELASHGRGSVRAWIAIRGTVYDVTDFISSHPGGPSVLMGYLGKNATAAYDGQHSHIDPRRYADAVGTLIN